MDYSIGEFSKITRVSVKALRLYHEKGLLRPDFIDPQSGYRYYSAAQFYEIQLIGQLKAMGFTLQEIREIIDQCEEDQDLVNLLSHKKRELERKVKSFRESITVIEILLEKEKHAMNDNTQIDRVELKDIPDMLIAGHRMCGRYKDMGRGFQLLGKHAGRYIQGPALALYYDGEYKEEDADYEACFPVSKPVEAAEVDCRTLPGGRAATLVHEGPYETLSESYKILMDYLKSKSFEAQVPSREIFLKGPGMVLKGNPRKYRTEIQFLLKA